MLIATHHGGLVKIVARFLNKAGLRDRKFRTADLGLVLNLISQADYNDKIMIPTDEQLINKAFKFKEEAEGGRRSVLPLVHLLDSVKEGDKTFLLVEKKREKGEDGCNGNTCTTIGVFSSVQVANQTTQISPIMKWDAHHSISNLLVKWLKSESGRRLKKAKSRRRVSSGEASTSDKRHKISDPTLHEEEKGTSVLHYSLNGVVGMMHINPSGAVLGSDLVAHCEDLHYEDTDELRVERERTRWRLETVGAVQVMVPNRFSIVASNYLSKLKKFKEMDRRLRHLFRGLRCRFKWENMRYLAAFGLHNLGGSVEGLQMAVAATIRMIANEMGFVVTNEKLGIGCPS